MADLAPHGTQELIAGQQLGQPHGEAYVSPEHVGLVTELLAISALVSDSPMRVTITRDGPRFIVRTDPT